MPELSLQDLFGGRTGNINLTTQQRHVSLQVISGGQDGTLFLRLPNRLKDKNCHLLKLQYIINNLPNSLSFL